MEVCYICREEIVDDDDVIKPCKCSMRTHKKCVNEQLEKGDIKCGQCREDYEVDVVKTVNYQFISNFVLVILAILPPIELCILISFNETLKSSIIVYGTFIALLISFNFLIFKFGTPICSHINENIIISCIYLLELVLPFILYPIGHLHYFIEERLDILPNVTISDNFFDSNYLSFGMGSIFIIIIVLGILAITISSIYIYFKHNKNKNKKRVIVIFIFIIIPLIAHIILSIIDKSVITILFLVFIYIIAVYILYIYKDKYDDDTEIFSLINKGESLTNKGESSTNKGGIFFVITICAIETVSLCLYYPIGLFIMYIFPQLYSKSFIISMGMCTIYSLMTIIFFIYFIVIWSKKKCVTEKHIIL